MPRAMPPSWRRATAYRSSPAGFSAGFGISLASAFSSRRATRVVSEQQDHLRVQHIEMLKNGGKPELLANARWGPPDEATAAVVKHNVYQWDLVFTNNDLFKGGWAGQGLLVNPDRDLVAVYAGYFNDDQSELDVLPRLRQVLNGVFGDRDGRQVGDE